MNTVRTKYNSACSCVEDHLRASSNPIEATDLIAFKTAVHKLEETEVDRLSDHLNAVSTRALKHLQSQNDVLLKQNQFKLITLRNIAKIAVGAFLFLGACSCLITSRHAYGLGLFGLAFAAIGEFFYDLRWQRNFPKRQKHSFECLKNIHQTKVTQLTNQILTVKNTTLRAQREAIAAERDAIVANIEVIALERIKEIANHLVNFASSSSDNSDANRENLHCIIEELV